jgi:2-C-methyl-D-erythritol 4-phosphate cytidylyltransferase
MGQEALPKQFAQLGGTPLIMRVLRQFDDFSDIDSIIVGAPPDYSDALREMARGCGIKKLAAVIQGGATRQETVYKCLSIAKMRAGAFKSDIVMIHDAARPFVTQEIINENLRSAEEHGTAVTAVKVKDATFKSRDGSIAGEIVPREGLYLAQTPQTFRFSLIFEAHENAITQGIKNALDDASLVQAIGFPVRMVGGSSFNFKVTTPDDMALAQAIADILPKIPESDLTAFTNEGR